MSLNLENIASIKLPNPPVYFPIERKQYEVSVGLKPLGFNLGNPGFDDKVFQIHSEFYKSRENKLNCRKERLSKYFLTSKELTLKQKGELARFIIEKLCADYPAIFKHTLDHGQGVLECRHTQDIIEYSVDSNNLIECQNIKFKSVETITPNVVDLIDALSLQVDEDIALLVRRSDKSDYLGLLHLCSPSHWAAEDKIDLNFFSIHEPIPHIEKINQAAANIVEAMINKGPFVRFIWSFVTDTRLNHHPVEPQGWNPTEWKGRSFNAELKDPFHLRIERQVVYGLPQIEASFFGIGITFIKGTDIRAHDQWREQLIGAINSMSTESETYKGLASCKQELLSWLNQN